MISFIHNWSKPNRVVISNSSSLIGTTALTSAFGFVYWWLAAHTFPPEAVGIASATVSAMVLLGSVGVLGFGTMLIGELPRQPGREKTLISTALIAVGVTEAGSAFYLPSSLPGYLQTWARFLRVLRISPCFL